MSSTPGNRLQGFGVSPGIAMGPVFFFDSRVRVAPRRRLGDAAIDAEIGRFRASLKSAEEELSRQREELTEGLNESERLIFDAHLEFYRDDIFREAIEQRIRGDKINAEAAIHDQVEHLSDVLKGAHAFHDRMADIRDVGNRLQRFLLREEQATLVGGTEAFVLYAKELLPSDTMALDRSRLLAIVTEVGGEASHVAILARAFGIPAVTGIKNLESLVHPGAAIAVDGVTGELLVRPDAGQQQTVSAAREAFLDERRMMASQATATTRVESEAGVEILLNIENFIGLDDGLIQSTQGVGLYRTEFLFMGRPSFPSEEEQFEFYKSVLERVGDREVTFRTIDVGGDKPLDYLRTPVEQNPVLGWRGIRMSFEWPDLLIPQLRALLRASAFGRLHIMLPMVTHVEEVREARQLLNRLSDDLAREGVELPRPVPLGAMIEIPSSALAAADLAAEVDFLSVGTNDLCQYLFAVDRNNLQVARLYQPLHPVMLRLLHSVFEAAGQQGRPVSVCGEMAGQPLSVLALFGLGLRRFSMSPAHVPEARWVFQSVEPAAAAELAQQLMGFKTQAEVEEALRRELGRTSGPSAQAGFPPK